MNDSTDTSHRRRKSHGRRNAIVAAVVVVAGAAGWYGLHKYRADAAAQSEYLFGTVQMGNIEDLVTATGTLEPRDYVDVGAQVSGQIEELFVEVGDEVKAGQVLAKIDAETSRARMESTEAALETQKNNLLTQRANLEKAERDFKRQQNLYAADATTYEQMINAETTLENARRQVRSSELGIAQQEANMRIDKKNLAYTDIIAPIDGTIMSISVKKGQTVNASQNVPNVMKIANLNTMTVRSEVSEADVAKLRKGMQVYFTTLSASSRRWPGELKRIEPTPKVQNSVVLYPALFDVQNEGSTLMPNMTVQVFFVAAEARNVLTVPMAALQQGQQIAREMAQKEREKNAGKEDAEAPGSGAAPAAGATVAGAPASAAGSAGPAAAATQGAAPAGDAAAPGAGAAREGQRGEGRQGQRAGGQGGFGGQRAGGGFPGFNPENMTPEQREQFRRMREQMGAGGGGFGGGFGGMGGGPRQSGQVQQRRGTVMVKKADGTLEARQVVVGVNDRVTGQVIEGLTEGEEVVIGRSDPAAAAAPAQPQNQFQQGGNRGGFPGGGGNFRPF